MKHRLKTNGFIIFVAVITVFIFPNLFFRNKNFVNMSGLGIPFGAALILIGQLLRVSARGYKAEHSRNGSMLIQGGPYGLVRNPMYLGILFIGFGIVLMLLQWWAALIYLAVFVIRYIKLIFKEEKKLMKLFPDDYARYCARVPRLFPSLATIVKNEVSASLPLKLSWIKKEIAPISIVLLITFSIVAWQNMRIAGIGGVERGTIGIFLVLVCFACFVGYLNARTMSAQKHGTDKSESN
jgi:protein-S-isoprenylcysteine O-methyltransferase Ste14